MRLRMLSISTLPSSKLQCLHPYSCSGSDWLRKAVPLGEVVEKFIAARANGMLLDEG